MGIMGWSSTGMAARYQHLTDPIRQDIARRVGGLIWKAPERPNPGADNGPDDDAAGVAVPA